MEKCLKKLMMAAVLMGSLMPVTYMYAMDVPDSDQQQLQQPEEEVKEAAAVKRIDFREITSVSNELVRTADPIERERLVDQFIKCYGSIDVKEEQYGYTLLMDVVTRGDVALATLLLDKGADVNFRSKDGVEALGFIMEASTMVDMITLLLERGADVKVTDNRGRSALSTTVCFGPIEATQLLVDKGADLYVGDGPDRALLSAAIEKSRRDIAQFLIFAGLDYKGIVPLGREQEQEREEAMSKGLTVIKKDSFPGQEFLQKLQDTQKAKEDLGKRDWSVERLADSDAFVQLPKEIVCIIAQLGGSLTGDETIDPLIDALVAKREATGL